MQKTKIEWADSTWNPITGCRHECSYCYARRMAQRFSGYGPDNQIGVTKLENGCYELDKRLRKGRPGRKTAAPYPFGFEPTLHCYKLNQPEKWKKPRTIFVGSMADIFGDWVPDDWIQEVFAACRKAPQHRYLFLTKNPGRYMELAKAGKLPNGTNFWYGSTITTPDMKFWWSVHHNTFLSIEPMLKPFLSDEGGSTVKKTNWIITGAVTGPGSAKHQPKPEWVTSLVQAADLAGVPVFMKDSMIPIVGEENMRREFPWEG